MAEPLVSIVLPTHNGSRYLDQAIESICLQTMPAWELIVVNDASTDDTRDKIQAWLARDPRIRWIDHVEKRGLPGALNDGFAIARGKYFTTTSDDNWHDLHALDVLTQALEAQPEIALVYAGYHLVNETGAVIGQQRALPIDLLPGRNVVGACFLFRREVFAELSGFDESLFLVEDYDFWLRASLGHRLKPLAETLYFYRVHAWSLSATKRREVAEAVIRCMTQWKPTTARLSAAQEAEYWLQLATAANDGGDRTRARSYLLQAWQHSGHWLRTSAGLRTAALIVLGPTLGRTAWRMLRLATWPLRWWTKNEKPMTND